MGCYRRKPRKAQFAFNKTPLNLCASGKSEFWVSANRNDISDKCRKLANTKIAYLASAGRAETADPNKLRRSLALVPKEQGVHKLPNLVATARTSRGAQQIAA